MEGRGRRGESNGLVDEEDLVAVTVSSNDRGLQTDAVSYTTSAKRQNTTFPNQ